VIAAIANQRCRRLVSMCCCAAIEEKMKPKEPTGDQCNQNSLVSETDHNVCYAIWYPQMGGYVGKAVAVMGKEPDPCIDVFVWHDGEFPFGEGEPREIHHCDPTQFIRFGEKLRDLQQKSA
jgi:hypothetical protein